MLKHKNEISVRQKEMNKKIIEGFAACGASLDEARTALLYFAKVMASQKGILLPKKFKK